MLLISPAELTTLTGRDVSALRRLENEGRLIRILVGNRPHYRWVDASPLVAKARPATWRRITRLLDDVSVSAARQVIEEEAALGGQI